MQSDFLGGSAEYMGDLSGDATQARFLPLSNALAPTSVAAGATVNFSSTPTERFTLMHLVLFPSAVGLWITQLQVKSRLMILGPGGFPVEFFTNLQNRGYYNLAGVLNTTDAVTLTVLNTTAGALTLSGCWMGKSDATVQGQ
jgi:hypothetical protein